MNGIRKILVVTNGSLDLVREGIRLAGDGKTRITVLRVVSPYAKGLDLAGVSNIRSNNRLVGDMFENEVQQIANANRTLIRTRMETGRIDKKIIDVAWEENCDLIIMDTGSRGLLNRLFGGSIVKKVNAGAPCPVLSVMGNA